MDKLNNNLNGFTTLKLDYLLERSINLYTIPEKIKKANKETKEKINYIKKLIENSKKVQANDIAILIQDEKAKKVFIEIYDICHDYKKVEEFIEYISQPFQPEIKEKIQFRIKAYIRSIKEIIYSPRFFLYNIPKTMKEIILKPEPNTENPTNPNVDIEERLSYLVLLTLEIFEELIKEIFSIKENLNSIQTK